KAGLAPTVAHLEVTKEDLDKKADRLFESLDPKGPPAGGYRSIRHAFFDITGLDPSRLMFGDEDINRMILRESIGVVPYDSTRSTESVAASTWNTVLGDAITRRMMAFYKLPSL